MQTNREQETSGESRELENIVDKRSYLPTHGKVVSANITWVEVKVTPEDRMNLMGHDAATVWLTGLSGSGKSTIACELERHLVLGGHAAYTLDGDNVRHGLSSDLGFAPQDRSENIRRIAEVCKLFNNAGTFVVTAFISPYAADRAMARDVIGADRFVEVHLATAIDVCERRDPKGLYKKARAGHIGEFTGISAPYEAPDRPSITIDTSRVSVEDSVGEILRSISQRFRKK